jgi:CCR4-NOT transcriptional complex subunit CAF120
MSSSYTLQEASRQPINLMSITNNIQANARGVGPGVSTAGPSSAEESGTNIFDEAGALYYMKEFETDGQNRRVPSTIAEDTDESQSDVTTPRNFPSRERSPALRIQTAPTAPVRSGTPGLLDRQMTTASMASSGLGLDGTVISHGTASKQPVPRVVPANPNIIAAVDHSDDESSAGHHNAMSERLHASSMTPDDNADALAALSFLEQEPSADQPAVTPKPPPPPPPPKVRTPSPPVDIETSAQFRSSFAPSKQAAERKARVQAQEAASHAAAHRPGRANGKRQSTMADRVGWNQSSDEEEEEDDDDDDADSDGPRPRAQHVAPNLVPPPPTQPLQPRPRHGSPVPPVDFSGDPHQRPPRNLPPLPGARPGESRFIVVQMCVLTFADRWFGISSWCVTFAKANV